MLAVVTCDALEQYRVAIYKRTLVGHVKKCLAVAVAIAVRHHFTDKRDRQPTCSVLKDATLVNLRQDNSGN